MSEFFPIRQGREVKLIPMGLMRPYETRAIRKYMMSLDDMSMGGGLTAGQAVAIIEGLDTPPLEIAATLMLKEHVDRYYAERGRTMQPAAPSPQPLAQTTLERLERGAALAKAMQRRVNGETTLHANYGELIEIMESAAVYARAMASRERR